MILKQAKTIDFDKNKKYVFIVSMGAIEQHGPFLPLGTDSYCQDAVLKKATEECPDAVFLPTLDITCSREHRGFPGTIWLEKSTMLLVLKDIVNSLSENASDIILTSWHGGNISVIDQFMADYGKVFPAIRFHHVNLDPPEIIEKTKEALGGPVDEHAGNSEISMMLASDESLVQEPSSAYPKKKITADWSDNATIKDQAHDGIVDAHPAWIVSKKHGSYFIDLSAEHLKNEVLKVLNAAKTELRNL